MITTLKTKAGFKATALAIAFSFLCQQISWADDPAVTALEKLNKEQSQTFAPDYLQNQQTANQSVIAQKQDVENIINSQNQTANNISDATEESSDTSIELQGPKSASSGQAGVTAPSTIIEEAANTPKGDGAILSVTTQDGDIVHYADGAISSIEKKDDTILRDLVIGESGNLLAAEIIYIDGTIQVVGNGKVIKITKPDKTVLNYNDDETLASISYPDDKTVAFSYIKDTAGAAIETILTDPEKISYYGSDNKLKRVEFNNGRKIEYEGGVISKITEADLGAFIFDIKADPGGAFTSNIAQYAAPDGAIYRYTVGEDGVLVSVTIEKDGMSAAYDKDGNLTGITKDGLAVTPETIAQAKADYDAALIVRKEKALCKALCLINLDDADRDLKTKESIMDNVKGILSSAVQSLNSAQAIKDSKQSDYDTANNQYLASKAAYNTNNAALNTAVSLEAEAYQALLASQSVLTNKKTVLNQKIQTSQVLKATVTTLNARLRSYQASLAKAQKSLEQAFKNEVAAQASYDSALSNVGAKEDAYNNAVKVRQTKEEVLNNATTQKAYNTANTALNNAIAAESRAQQSLANARNTLVSKETSLNNKIAARQAIETTIANLNTEIASYGSRLSQAQQDLNSASDEELAARSDYNNAQADVNMKKTAYADATKDRQAKKTALNTSAADLKTKTGAKDKAYKDLQIAIKNLAKAQAAKDTAQKAYNSVYAAYSSAQTKYDRVLTGFNNAKSEEDAAKASADSLLGTLNTLRSISSIFPQKDAVLQNANSKLEAISILYDAERRAKEVHKANGDIQKYTGGLVNSIVSGSETTLYSYDLSALGNIDGITVDRDGIKRIYDKYGNIQSLSLDDATKIVYENGKVKEIQKSDGTTLKNMTFRDSGELDSALVSYPDGSLALYDDAKLLQAISASGDVTDYKDGKIRKVTLEDGTVYDWSYDGDNIIIQDNAKGEKRTYFEGKLIALEELTGSKLTTRYYYDGASGDLSRSEICRNNEILYTYTYAYEGGLTLVRDEDGNTQAYTKDKKLSYIIDSKGRKYSYTYVGKNEGYVDVYFPSGNRAKYDLSGNIIEITKSDGTVIKDIVFYDDSTPRNFTYIKDGATYKVEEGKIEEVLSKDGVKTVYYDNGFVKSIGTETADLTEYQYFVKDSKVFNNSSALSNSGFNQLSLYNSNSATYIALSQDSLQFGTGSDGAKHVTADEILKAGTYNFESLTIDPGKILMVAPGAVIKTLDTVTVNGAIFCGGSLDIYAYDFNVSASGSVTGAVNIKCNTINNAGIITGNASITGALSNGANELDRDDSFSGLAHYLDYNPGVGSLSPHITFPSCTISSVKWRTGGAGSGNSQGYGILYLYIDGVKTQVSPTYYWGRCPGSFDTGVATINGSWNNVTGIEYYIETDSTIGVARVYGYEMQAIIGQPTIEYINGNPGAANTTPSRPTASIKQPDNPSSGSFESDVIELNALELGSISWSEALPEGTNITFQTRTGDTLAPDSTWSAWSAELTSPASSQITSPKGKYIQYRANLYTTNSSVTPLLKVGENSPITFGYSRAPAGSSELSGIYYATVSKDGVTAACDKNSLPSLVFDPDYMDAVTSEIPGYLLNGTQKELYLKDSVIISELTAIKSIDGTTTEYCQGQISKITRSDGTIIKSASFDVDNNAKDFTYSKDGATYIVKDGKIDTVVTASGESVKYYSYGLIESAETGSSKKEYEYGIQTGENYTTKSVFQNGSFNNASILGQNSTTYLQLSKDPLRFGTGLDGAKHVTANETLEAGTYNFESITIDAGKALIVAPGAIIKVLDTVTVNGAIFCGGTLDIYAPSFNVSSSGSVTGAVNIKCNTINNIGIITGNACMTGSGGTGVTTDDNFSTGMSGSHGAGGSAVVTFPSCNISKARYRASLGSYGLPAYANVYLCVNGSWTCIASYAGAGDSGVADNTTGWSNVTGMMITGQSQNGNCVCSSYSLNEMQAIIGQSTIEYISGSPGTINTTPSRPTVSIKATDNPSSGSFESGVIELNALDLDSISWNQELPEGTNITFQTRTGDTLAPDSTWSDWSQSLTNPKGSGISSPGKKYLQYKINLSTSDPSITPKVILDNAHGISISYIKISDNPLDPYVKVKESSLRANGVSEAISSTYNKSGALIWTEDAAGVRTGHDPANPEGTIDIAPLKFDPSYTDSLARDLPSSKLSDAQKVITVYDQGNDTPVEIITAGQSITYFDEGFATKVVDKNGVTQVAYTYDKDKNITKVEFVDARQKLEENYQKALAEITTQKDTALAKLAKAETNARADIVAKSADIQKQIDSERSRLIQEKAKYDPNVYDLSEFDRAFREIDDYETRLRQQTQDAYTDLDNQLAAAKARIESDASTAMQSLINNDYNKILCDIVQKESSPIIYQYYRKVLGRDPGDDDLLYWANKIKNRTTSNVKANIESISPKEITLYLRDLSEREERADRKENIIGALTEFFTQYISADQAQKDAMVSSLGLSPDETVNLEQADIDAILSWLIGQSLHFGDSAFETIIAMLKNNGIDRSFEDIGESALKVDILTGVITKGTEGDLMISMYAMRKAAEANGLTLSSQKISYDDLLDQISKNNVIVHIDGKHYVLVTSINDTDGTITYIDPTVGHNGQAMTLSRAEFMEKWRGYSLSKELSYNKDLPGNPSKQINVTQEKNIRGSGWWSDFWKGIVNFFQKIIAPVATILTFIPGLQPIGLVLHAINVVVQTVSFVVKTGTLMDIVWASVNAIGSYIGSVVVPNIFEAAGKAFQGVGSFINNAFSSFNGILAPIKNVFSAAADIFNVFSGAITNIATRIGSVVNMGSIFGDIASNLVTTVVTQSINLGANYLFRSMGLDPSFANIGSALMSGAITGGLTGGDNIGLSIIGGAMKYGTIAGVGEIGKAVGLDPNITSLSAMFAGSLVGGMFTTPTGKTFSYDDLMKDIAPHVLSECAYIGVTEVGELLGIDSRISYLAGIGINSSLQAGLTDGFKPDVLWKGITDGLLRGSVTIGIEVATQSLDPLFGAITARVLSGAIAGGLSQDHDIFKGIYQALLDSTGSLLTLDGPGNNAWQQAVYIAKILDVSQMIQEKGLAQTLETYATSIFYRDAVESMIQNGGTVFNYIQTALTNPQALPANLRPTSTTFEGAPALVVPTGDTGDYIVISADGSKVLAQSKGTYYNEGEFGIDYEGQMVLKNGTTTNYTKLGIVNADIQNYSLTDAEFQSYDGNVAYDISGENGKYVQFDSNGDFKNAVIKDLTTNTNVVVRDGNYVTNQASSTLQESLSQSSPWYSQFALSKYADITDQKVDQIAGWFLGDAQNNMGWVLTATAVNSAKDIFKATVTDIFRLGESLPGAMDDFSGAWQAAQNGDPLSAGYQAFLGSGKILQEVGRALVIGSVVKGLAVSAVKLESQVAADEALIAAKQLAAQAGKKTTVLGHYPENIAYKDWPNHNVLNLPDGTWSWTKNQQWLDEAIARGDDILVVSSNVKPGSTLEDEINYLISKGFERVGNYMKKR